MVDFDPEIWENKTLGAAANNERLDVVEKQQLEDRNAKLEDRTPREVVVENNYPGWEPEKGRSSHAAVVHFADEKDNDIQYPGDSGKPESNDSGGGDFDSATTRVAKTTSSSKSSGKSS